MKTLLLTLSILLVGGKVFCCSGCGCSAKKQDIKKVEEIEIKYIDKAKLQEMIKSNQNLKIIDVLSPESYAKNHIKGAINIPLKKLRDHLKNLKKNDTIVVYCASSKCQASTKAAKLLMASGFKNVYDYKNGIAEWTKSKLPTETAKLCGCGAAKGSPSCCK